MKKLLAVLSLVLLLSGCSRGNPALDRAMALRADLLAAAGCRFTADITADYGDALHSFTLACQGDSQGAVTFTVTAPESISGITGTLDQAGGAITFDGKALALDYLTDDQLSPVSAPWVFLRTLRGGYLTSAAMEGEQVHITARDTYEDNALTLDIWLEAGNLPVRSEILWDGRRILTLTLRDFRVEPVHA